MYRKLLTPPSGLVYRFVGHLSPREASKLFLNDLPTKEIVSEPNKAFYVSPIGKIERPAASSTISSGKTNVSSWTTSPTMPDFGEFSASYDGEVSILLVAKTQGNNFVLNPKQMEKLQNPMLSGDPGFGLEIDTDMIEAEQEVIGFGPIDVLEASFIYVGSKDYYSEMSPLRARVPKTLSRAKLKALASGMVPAEAFGPVLDYVNQVITSYAKSLTKQGAEEVKASYPYRLLLAGSSKGMSLTVPGNNFGQWAKTPESRFDTVERAGLGVISEITEFLNSGIEDKEMSESEIQVKLVHALSLKMKKSSW
jgi:hypothetical protein